MCLAVGMRAALNSDLFFFPGSVNPACWIQFVDFVIAKTAPQYSTPPAFLSVKCPQITPPGEGQTPIIWVIESE